MKDSFEFDELIKSEIGELPPSDQMVEAVSPWIWENTGMQKPWPINTEI